LKGDYSFFEGQTKEMIKCINCGWFGFLPASNNLAKQEEVLADPDGAKIQKIIPTPPSMKNIEKKEHVMSTPKSTCPTCKRSDVTLVTSTKCGRCHDRIKKGKNPITGEPEPAKAQQTANTDGPLQHRSLLEEVTWRLIHQGYKGTAVSRAFKLQNIPETTSIDEAIVMVAQFLGNEAAGEPADSSSKPAATAVGKGISSLLHHPEAHTLVLQLPDDVWQSLQEHEVTPADIVELLRDLVNLRLVKVAA
jgi:hypothetical protein